MHRVSGQSDQADRATRVSINGRFLGQPVTGVQRYGREILHAMHQLIGADKDLPEILVPPRMAIGGEAPPFPIRATGWGSGHIWEQFALPFRRRGTLVSFCNTAPIALKQQIVCIHDANIFLIPASFSPAFRAAYRILLPAVGHRAAVVTTVSRASADKLEQLGIVPRGKIVVLPNGHEHVYRWDPARSRLFENVPPKRPFVLLIGSRARHKNALLVLRLAPRLDELGLDVFVAGGKASVFAEEHADPAARNVRLLGYVSDDDLALLYRSAFCLAFPSLWEGFGLPLVEAMALGCPIIASNTSSMPEVCGNAALFATPTDPADWFAQFQRLTHSPGLRAELIARGRDRIPAYSWRDSAAGYLEQMDL